ncbi:MAG TPA: transglutaminase domain-containing protein [Drouetiella sp.]
MLNVKESALPTDWAIGDERYRYHLDSDTSGRCSGWIQGDANFNRDGKLSKLSVDVADYRGKRLKLSALCRAENVGKAGLSVRLERKSGKYIAHDDMMNRPLSGSLDWTLCEVVLDVPTYVDKISFGVYMRGGGQIWFKDLQLAVTTGEATPTNDYAFGCVGQWDMEPLNLDFSIDEYPELREGRCYISEARRWVISSYGEKLYDFQRSTEELFDGKPSGLIKPVAEADYGLLYQHIGAAKYRGKRIRFSAHAKTKSVTKGAWLRICVFNGDGTDLIVGFSNAGLKGDTDWTKLEVDFDVPKEAWVIDIGADLSGDGELYLGGLQFEVLGQMVQDHCELLPDIGLYQQSETSMKLERAELVSELPNRPGFGIRLNGVRPGPQMKSSTGYRLIDVPVQRELTFSCALLGCASGQKVKVVIYAYDAAWKSLERSVSHVALVIGEWTRFETKFVAPPETVRLNIFVISVSPQPVYFTDPSLLVGNDFAKQESYNKDFSRPKNRLGTKIVKASYKAGVRAETSDGEGVVTFPIPGPYRDQIPLTFDLKTKPKDALLGYEIQQRDDGINWLAKVRVKPLRKGAVIEWDSLVLIRGGAENKLPAISFTNHYFKQALPPDAVAWLESTKCVQSDDFGIAQKAVQLAKDSSDLESFVRAVIAFTSKNKYVAKKFNSLDAKTALTAGGSCTSRANLAAALLRAQGVPARTVSHLPTWYNGYMFEHWLVEYWHPEQGWVWVEPTLEIFQPPANELVVLAVSSADDENKCDDLFHLRYLMPGGAYLSGCELSSELHCSNVLKRTNAPNNATEQSEISGDVSEQAVLFEAALKNFRNICAQTNFDSKAAKHTKSILEAAYTGNSKALASCLRRE